MKTKLMVAVLMTVVAMVGADGTSLSALAGQDRAATLLTAVRAALGGEQKLAAVKAISVEGPWRRTVAGRASDSYVTLLIVRPNQLRRSDERKFFSTVTERIATFDGTQAWEETDRRTGAGGFGGGAEHGGGAGHGPGGYDAAGDHDHGQAGDGPDAADSASATAGLTPEQINQARVRRMKMELQRWTIALLADSPQPFVDAGRAESPDGPADVLETKDEMGRAVRYFIDPASHLPLMLQYQEVRSAPAPPVAAGPRDDAEALRRRVEAMRAQGGPQTVTVSMRLSDYKKVDGVLLPHQIDIASEGRAGEAWVIDGYKLNPKVKPNAFQRSAK